MATANTYLRVTELEFGSIRDNLKTYLSSQTHLQDYDYEGSVMATMLDVLAYNTHYNAYYLNMLANEMFLDTAQQRDSVVSRAKELGYVPNSAIGSSVEATITFTGVTSTTSSITLAKNSTFTSTIDDVTYTFVAPQAYTIAESSGTYSGTITLKEGEPLTHRFTVSASNPVRYIIPNANVDTSSITVKVQASAADTETTEFTRATNIKQLFKTSPIYFLEEAGDGKYEIVFGTGGALGKNVKDGEIVIVEYLVCNGEATNGTQSLSVGTLTTDNTYTGVTISANKKSSGGRPQETIESIKLNAPRNYQTQNRAIVDNDYERIILAENSDLQSVVAFGGEKASPPVYGKVYVAVKPFGEEFATANRKTELRESILTRTPLGIDPVIIDANYTYLIPSITTFYDKSATTLNEAAIGDQIRTAVKSFATNNLERFGNKLRYSRFVRSLDNTSTNGEILNNDATILMQKRFVPNLNVSEKVDLAFNNPIRPGTLTSTQFTYSGFLAYLDDDSKGNVNIYRFDSDKNKVNIIAAAGSVDYTTGEVIVEAFKPTAYADVEIKVTVTPDRLDIIPVREQILLMNSNDAIINVVPEYL